jgi:hypothetical protein
MITPYQTNVKEQYEELGHFVEAFEAMVNEARQTCIELLSKDGRHRDLIQIILHHQALAAKTIFEMCRAVIAEIINSAIELENAMKKGIVDLDPPHLVDREGRPSRFSIAERDGYLGLMRFIASEYDDLINKRNNLLHATWFIGYSGADDPNCKEFFAHKYTVNKEGFALLELPKTAAELRELLGRCDAVQSWIGWLQCALTNEASFKYLFRQDGKQWFLKTNNHETTLPYKSPPSSSEAPPDQGSPNPK